MYYTISFATTDTNKIAEENKYAFARIYMRHMYHVFYIPARSKSKVLQLVS